jgi:hypothetical protein
MEKEDVRYYKLFANRMYYSLDRKDLQLFDDIYQGGDQFNEEKTMNRCITGVTEILYRRSTAC